MTNIPPPPQLQIASDASAYVLGVGGLVMGTLLMLWGRHVGRAVVMAVLASVGWWIGKNYAPQFNFDPRLLPLGGTAGGAIVGLVLGRAAWALLAAVVCGACGAAAVLAWFWPEVNIAPLTGGDYSMPDYSILEYAVGMGGLLERAFWNLWPSHMQALLVTACVPTAVALLAGLFWPRLVQILMTSLVGALAAVAGLALVLSGVRPDIGDVLWQYWPLPVGLAGVLAMLGAMWQARCTLLDDKKKAQEKAQTDKFAEQPKQQKTKKKK